MKKKKKQSVHKLLLQNKSDIIVPIKMNILRIGNQGIKLLTEPGFLFVTLTIRKIF